MSAADWRTLVSRLFRDARFSPPAGVEDLDAAERQLSVKLPGELRSFYLETNGVHADQGAALVWNVAELVTQNRAFRTTAEFATLYMSFDNLLFFGQRGSGDQAAYRVLAGRVDSMDIFEWDHENDSRTWFARDLRDYFERAVPPA
jgi:hypothetical protein